MSKLTTHILDTAHGCPGAGITVRLFDSTGAVLVKTATNKDGRCDQPLLSGETMKVGAYRLEFDAGAYFRSLGIKLPTPPFLDVVSIQFGISDTTAHYHVPLLVSPYGYSTYRGS